MKMRPSPLSPDSWLTEMFKSNAAAPGGGVIRRATCDIERFVGRDAFACELERRGFQAIENAGQIMIFFHREPIRRVK